MSPQFCKIGNSSPISKKVIKLRKRYKQLIEQAYNISMTDAGLSDILYYKAFKIKKALFESNNRHVAL
ncbi:Lacal_2735 family protein [Hanstruepera marina]|uniref:Lacal_2735 family protein n=1 Tax=Hanstruepera marina TaxID=2873265 RepID=UPI001CA705D0|nr:Lacal_2735 family protein [Hanstruepera marina]